MAAGITLNRNRQVPAEDTPAFGGIAERFRRAGDLDRAIALCRDGLKKFPDHLSARVTLGWALLDQGKYDEARVELEQALKRAPDNLAAIRGLAELHDRAEHTMLLPMDGPGQWPPDAEAIDALEQGAANDSLGVPLEPPAAAAEPRPAAVASDAAQDDDLQLLALRGVQPAARAPEPAAPPPPSTEKPARKAGKRASTRKRREVEEAAAAPEPASLKGGPKTFDFNDLKDVEIPETPTPAPVTAAEIVAPQMVASPPAPPATVAAPEPATPPVREPAEAPELGAVEQPISDPDLEAAIRDLAPIEDTITPPVVDLAEAGSLSLDDLAKDLGANEPLFGPLPGDSVDLDALIAEANAVEAASVEPAAEPALYLVEPAVVAVPEPVAAVLAPEPEVPTGPVFELTNPTPEDFPLPLEDNDEELAAVAAGLSSFRYEFYPLALLDAIVEEVPAGPFLELTNPTIDDFPEPIDPEDITDSDVLAGFEEVKAELPLIELMASLPDVEPEVVLAPPPVPRSLIALERFLRQVENRRATLVSQSRA